VLTYPAIQRQTVERLRAFDAAALALAIERRLRWIAHCAAVHARGEVTDCGGTAEHLCAEAREGN
jgi:hypothetical protein